MTASGRLAAALAVVGALLALALAPAHTHERDGADDGPVGWDGRRIALKDAASDIAAVLNRRSYAPGEVATVHLLHPLQGGQLQVFHAGYGHEGPMQGAPVTAPEPVASGAGQASVTIGSWPSGLYYVRLTGPGTGYAPFVVRSRQPATARVAVVLPTNTWQAYNFRDDDGDGTPNSWYASSSVSCVGLDRPFLGNGVPPHYVYDRGFERWLALTHRDVDYLSDDDLDRMSGTRLHALYDLVVFPGHHEYVSEREYEAVEAFRNLGGNLAFLSANNLFRRVERRGQDVCLVGRFRDAGQPEARVIGVQYVDWNHDRFPNQPFTVTGADRAPWLFRGTGLRDGSRFGTYGIEIDARAAQSPRGTQVLARIPGAFGPGESAEMTYYETPRGAKVFAAGVINFGSSALWPVTRVLLGNLWLRLARP